MINSFLRIKNSRRLIYRFIGDEVASLCPLKIKRNYSSTLRYIKYKELTQTKLPIGSTNYMDVSREFFARR